MKVMKFGGGCLKNGEHLLKVAEIIKSEKDCAVVVVSALSGITDLLENGIQKSMKSSKKVTEIINTIGNLHNDVAEASIKNDEMKQRLMKDIKTKLKRLERLFYGIAYTEEITETIRALILSYGERLSALVLSGVLNSLDKDAMAMEADKIGLITDESFENATAILPEVKKNLSSKIMPLIDRGKVPVITGYFGCTHEGKVTTFGRNGSDYSAAVVAYGMDATLLEIWKDVDGFMSADPKVVKSPHRIDKLSYYEAAELSYFGAKIIHPRTSEPLVDVNIPVHIRNLYNLESEGTEVFYGGYERQDVIKSVTYNKNISLLRIYGAGVGYKPGIIAEIGSILSDMGINIYSVITSQTCINLLLDMKDSRRSYESIKKLVGGIIEKIDLEDNIALIAVIGEGLLERRGVAARIFSAVAEASVNIEMISSGASEVASYFIVQEKDVRKAVNAIHREFFEEVK
ncbi:MAG: aspartate kinase [Candidatus Aminicenantales bacterium]